MKIAVTYENGQVFQHFGHTEEFKVYDTEDKKILSSQVVGTGGSGHEALAVFLKNLGVEVLICGGIGGGARTALAQAGIELYPGASGDADQAVEALLSGSLVYDPNTVCSHHHEGGEHNCHGHGHSCGEHNYKRKKANKAKRCRYVDMDSRTGIFHVLFLQQAGLQQ